MTQAVGFDKTIENAYYADGQLFAGLPCVIGHNSNFPAYYQLCNAFIDVAKHSSGWRNETGTFTTDADGWLTALTGDIEKILIFDTDNYTSGNYTITWSGTATLNVKNHTQTVVSPNKHTFEVSSSIDPTLWLVFSNGTVTNLNCYLTTDETAFLAGDTYKQDYLDLFTNASTVRVAKLAGISTNGNRDYVIAKQAHTWVERNFPPEAAAALANEANTALWVCLPHQVTDSYVTTYFTRLVAELDAGRIVYVEYSNEVWNYSFPFAEQTNYVYYDNSPTIIATITGGITQYVAHGMTTGDEVRMFMTDDTGLAAPWALGDTMYAIVRTVDTLEFAETLAEALADTVFAPFTGMTECRFKKMVGYTFSSAQAHINYNTRTREIWAIADSILTRARCVHITGSQSAGAVSITNPRMRDPLQESETDLVAIAPYTDYMGLTDWVNATNQELLAELKAENIAMIDTIRGHSVYTGKPIICYEGGDETFPAAGAETTKAQAFYDSDEMLEYLPHYGTMLANAHIQEICLFLSHETLFGLQSKIGDTSTKKWVSLQPYLTNGFHRGTL